MFVLHARVTRFGMPLRVAGGFWPLRVAGAFRQKPFVHMPLRVAAFVPLRVAGAFRQKPFWQAFLSREPFRLVPAPSNRAGATPCTRNEPLWPAKIGLPCLGCGRLLLARIAIRAYRMARCPST
jgi:hypothetical protein